MLWTIETLVPSLQVRYCYVDFKETILRFFFEALSGLNNVECLSADQYINSVHKTVLTYLENYDYSENKGIRNEEKASDASTENVYLKNQYRLSVSAVLFV